MTQWRALCRLAVVAVVTLGAAGTPALAAWNSSAVAAGPAKSYIAAAFRAEPGSVPAQELRLDPIDPALIEQAKRANAASWAKALQIGIHRAAGEFPQADGAFLVWQPVPGGHAARWELTSPGAVALRVSFDVAHASPGLELRFAGATDSTIYGPFGAAEAIAQGEPYWSPVLTGETAIVELFVPGEQDPYETQVSVDQVSHLFVHPGEPRAEMLAKGGESQSCEIDLVCRTGSDAALAAVGKAVARMTFSSSGGTALCTGTLLNPTGTRYPYFYSANHCISTQSTASTLTTHWFYDRTGCGSGSTSASYVQLAGGATLLYANEASDALLLRLNADPPAGAVYAAWDSTTLSNGTALTAVHHPAGDWKKVSLATMGGFGNIGSPSGSFIISTWTLGVTEGGSSGSGIFTGVGSPVSEYRFRGGLYGGPSSCTAPASERYDYYSRFDQVYASISQYLNPATTPTTYTLTVSRTGTGSGTVTSSPAGISCGSTCSASFTGGTVVTLTATAATGSTFAGWSGACTGTGTCSAAMGANTSVSAAFSTNAPPALELSATSLDFGGQLVNTASFAKTLTVRNSGGGTLNVSALAVSSRFTMSHNCAALTGGASCAVNVTFSPTAQESVTGTLSITTDAGSGSVTLTGRGEGSLVSHYYQSILRRPPDAGGLAFWDSEAVRVSGLAANVNEVWFAMALSFFSSSEYVALGRDDAGYVTDLYNTFFQRPPDSAGLGYWTGQLSQGLPREVALVSFMFSSEFATFTGGLYGNTAARAEVDAVMDLYRGLLARLPDSSGLTYWVQQFRTAQCQGSNAVTMLVDQISSAFVGSSEYAGRGRSNAQYVGDLYNAFLRRGADLAGVSFWIGELDAGRRTREQVRQSFLSSPEFQARVSAVIAQGCSS